MKVYIRGTGNNSNLEFYTDEGPDPLSIEVDIPQGSSLSWKVRSVYGGHNGLYHIFKDGIISSLWVNGPDFNTSGERTEPHENDFDFNALMVFPNPATENTLNVKINSGQEVPATLEIMNGIGQIFKQENILLYGGSNLYMSDVATLQRGVYFVRVSEGNKVHTVKFMIL